MFFQRRSGGITWLVVGLGNPGSKYESTRHNMGFLAADLLAEREHFRFNRLRFHAWTADVTLGGERVLVMKPQTYMNLSGEAVGAAARFYKIPADHVLVISDDISLPAGKLRIRAGGSAGGHNGLKNIIHHLGTDRFPRIKVGVGSPDRPEYDVVDLVIGKPIGEEQKVLFDALGRAADAVSVVIGQGVDRAMNRFN
jgi:PTH1 family peptidyl-tRNA hydrolase